MGWASATDIFDTAVDVALGLYAQGVYTEGRDYTPENIGYVVDKMYNGVEWDDWDTQDESKYFDPYLENVMRRNGEIDDE